MHIFEVMEGNAQGTLEWKMGQSFIANHTPPTRLHLPQKACQGLDTVLEVLLIPHEQKQTGCVS